MATSASNILSLPIPVLGMSCRFLGMPDLLAVTRTCSAFNTAQKRDPVTRKYKDHDKALVSAKQLLSPRGIRIHTEDRKLWVILSSAEQLSFVLTQADILCHTHALGVIHGEQINTSDLLSFFSTRTTQLSKLLLSRTSLTDQNYEDLHQLLRQKSMTALTLHHLQGVSKTEEVAQKLTTEQTETAVVGTDKSVYIETTLGMKGHLLQLGNFLNLIRSDATSPSEVTEALKLLEPGDQTAILVNLWTAVAWQTPDENTPAPQLLKEHPKAVATQAAVLIRMAELNRIHHEIID